MQKLHNYCPVEVKSDEAKVVWLPIYDTNNVDLSIQYLKSLYHWSFKHVPHIEKHVSGKPCPWLDIDSQKLMNRHNQTLRKAKNSKSDDDWKSYKTLRNKFNEKIGKVKSNHHKGGLNYNIKKPRKFQSQIKNIFLRKSQSLVNISADKRLSLTRPSGFYSIMTSKLSFYLT